MELERAYELIEDEEENEDSEHSISLGAAMHAIESLGFYYWAAEHDIIYGPNFEEFVKVIREDMFIKLIQSGWFRDMDSECIATFV